MIHTAADLGRAKLAILAARATELNVPMRVQTSILDDRRHGGFSATTLLFALWEHGHAADAVEAAIREFERRLAPPYDRSRTRLIVQKSTAPPMMGLYYPSSLPVSSGWWWDYRIELEDGGPL